MAEMLWWLWKQRCHKAEGFLHSSGVKELPLRQTGWQLMINGDRRNQRKQFDSLNPLCVKRHAVAKTCLFCLFDLFLTSQTPTLPASKKSGTIRYIELTMMVVTEPNYSISQEYNN